MNHEKINGIIHVTGETVDVWELRSSLCEIVIAFVAGMLVAILVLATASFFAGYRDQLEGDSPWRP